MVGSSLKYRTPAGAVNKYLVDIAEVRAVKVYNSKTRIAQIVIASFLPRYMSAIMRGLQPSKD